MIMRDEGTKGRKHKQLTLQQFYTYRREENKNDDRKGRKNEMKDDKEKEDEKKNEYVFGSTDIRTRMKQKSGMKETKEPAKRTVKDIKRWFEERLEMEGNENGTVQKAERAQQIENRTEERRDEENLKRLTEKCEDTRDKDEGEDRRKERNKREHDKARSKVKEKVTVTPVKRLQTAKTLGHPDRGRHRDLDTQRRPQNSPGGAQCEEK